MVNPPKRRCSLPPPRRDCTGSRRRNCWWRAFDSRRKLMSVTAQKPEGSFVFAKGAPEFLLPRCTRCRSEGRDLRWTTRSGAGYRPRQTALRQRDAG